MKILSCVFIIAGLTISSCSQTKVEQQNITEKQLLQTKEEIMAILDTVFWADQTPLRMRDSMSEIYGPESEEAQKYQRQAWDAHPENIRKVKEILGPESWPDTTLVGAEGNRIIALILQHSDQETREEYLPRMKQAVLDKKLEARWLVRHQDRLATDNGELQIYGGQMKYYPETKSFNVWPVYDPENIDKRRAEIGLVPIAEHLMNRFDFEWNLEEQIIRSKEFEKGNNLSSVE